MYSNYSCDKDRCVEADSSYGGAHRRFNAAAGLRNYAIHILGYNYAENWLEGCIKVHVTTSQAHLDLAELSVRHPKRMDSE
jgi:hypothetical protein